MFELINRQHKTKELQTVFDAHRDLRNNPTVLLNWIKKGTNPELISFLHTYKCSPAMKDHIRDYLPTISQTSFTSLSGGQAYVLRDRGQPKCKIGHVFNSHWGPNSTVC
jgi:hypothetical protein